MNGDHNCTSEGVESMVQSSRISQSVDVCRGRLVRHVNLIVIDTLPPTRPHPAGLIFLFLLNRNNRASYHRVSLLTVPSGVSSLFFSFSITSCRLHAVARLRMRGGCQSSVRATSSIRYASSTSSCFTSLKPDRRIPHSMPRGTSFTSSLIRLRESSG